eukprot:4237613-Amphidinium_carterae.1
MQSRCDSSALQVSLATNTSKGSIAQKHVWSQHAHGTSLDNVNWITCISVSQHCLAARCRSSVPTY